MKNCQVWSSVTLKFWSNLKPWINLKESVRLVQQKPFSMAPLSFYRSLFFISLTPKPCYATETECAIQPLSHAISQGVKSRKHQVKSRRPEQWSEAERQPSPGSGREQPGQRAQGPTAEPQQPSLPHAKRCWTVGNKILWLHCTE